MSRIIKSHNVNHKEYEKRVIELKMLRMNEDDSNETDVDSLLTFERIIGDAKKQAEKIVEDSIGYSNSIRQKILQEQRDWEEEKHTLRKKVSEEGYHTGVLEGREAGYAEYVSLLDEARQIIGLSKQDYEAYLNSSEEVILNLGIKVAEKIIGTHLNKDPKDFIHLVKNAIKEVKEHSDITIQVNPKFYNYVLSQKDELEAALGRDRDIFIYPQEDLAETDCILESSFGKINASIDSQLIEMKEKLLALLLEG